MGTATSDISAGINPEDMIARAHTILSAVTAMSPEEQLASTADILEESNRLLTELNFFKELNNTADYRLPNETAPEGFDFTGPVTYEYPYIKDDGSFWTTNEFEDVIAVVNTVISAIENL